MNREITGECENNLHEWSKPLGEYSTSIFKNCLKCGKENPSWETMTQNGTNGSSILKRLIN